MIQRLNEETGCHENTVLSTWRWRKQGWPRLSQTTDRWPRSRSLLLTLLNKYIFNLIKKYKILGDGHFNCSKYNTSFDGHLNNANIPVRFFGSCIKEVSLLYRNDFGEKGDTESYRQKYSHDK